MTNKGIAQLFEYASAYKFDEFDKAFAELEPAASEATMAEAYLMRAQIKLFTADHTALDDMDRAAQTVIQPQAPCLITKWVPNTANRFFVFDKSPGALKAFLDSLAPAAEKLAHWYGEVGAGMARQVQSEVLYFTGDIDQALLLANQQLTVGPTNYAQNMPAQYVQFRCYLAQGAVDAARQCLIDLSRIVGAHPECLPIYKNIRGWANLTTGWSGDTPRFRNPSSNEIIPVLDDRLDAIRKGISKLNPQEDAFCDYAKRHYSTAGTMRYYYMEIFNAVYWFQSNVYNQAEEFFINTYETAQSTGLLMPYVEYGKQIMPLLQFIRGNEHCSNEWLDRVQQRAEQYEDSLERYRA